MSMTWGPGLDAELRYRRERLALRWPARQRGVPSRPTRPGKSAGKGTGRPGTVTRSDVAAAA